MSATTSKIKLAELPVNIRDIGTKKGEVLMRDRDL